MRFDKTKTNKKTLTCQCETEDKKAEEFQISLFYWSFSHDIVAVKGLNNTNKCRFYGQLLDENA